MTGCRMGNIETRASRPRQDSGRHFGDRPKRAGSGLIPVTLGEVKRLLAHLITAPVDRMATWAWSHWRRRHQYRARQAHYQRRQTRNYEVRLEY
jgi:hypothetical protein